MKHRTPLSERSFYDEKPAKSKKVQPVALVADLPVNGGKMVAISEDEGDFVPSEKKRCCKTCSAPVAANSYYYCKKHKPRDEDDSGDYVYVGSNDGDYTFTGLDNEY